MNVIPFDSAKNMKEKTTRLPIIECIYKEGNVIKFEISGEKDIPRSLLEKIVLDKELDGANSTRLLYSYNVLF
ncbi:TPA: hypothetical protein ACGN8S_005188 [Bacillus cereus]